MYIGRSCLVSNAIRDSYGGVSQPRNACRVADLGHVLCTTYGIYKMTITNYGLPPNLIFLPRSFPVAAGFGAIVHPVVQVSNMLHIIVPIVTDRYPFDRQLSSTAFTNSREKCFWRDFVR
jgi:hypothetical protein